MKRQNKTIFSAELSITKIQLKKEKAIFTVVFRDITERVNYKRKIVESSLKFEAVFDQTFQLLMLLDMSGNIVEANRSAQTFFSTQTNNIIGKPFHENTYYQQSIESQQQLKNAIELAVQGKISRFDIRHRTNNDALVDIDFSIKPAYDNKNNVIFLIAEGRDITAQKKATHAAQEGSRLKSEFLANMSHEIRTPMNGVLGMTDALSKTTLTRQQIKYIDLIKQSGKSLLTVINDILDFSKIEAGKLTFEAIAFNLRDEVASILRLIDTENQRKNIEINYHIDANVPESVISDPVRFRQVITNLLNNALKFTEFGTVTLTIELLELVNNEATIQVNVQDTGIGMTTEQQDSIFQPFVQADGSTTRRFGGTGLGLSISSSLITMMGGRIRVKSVLNQGSTFYFAVTVPVDTTNQRHKNFLLGNGSSDFRVLVVDDNDIERHLLKHLIMHFGITPELATSGLKALNLMGKAQQKNKPFDMILLDIMMPDMDGFEVLKIMKEHGYSNKTKVVMITANDNPKNIVEYEESGADSCLIKPIITSDLSSIIKRHFSTQFNFIETPKVDLSKLAKQASHSRNPNSLSPLKILLVEDNEINQVYAVSVLEDLGHRITLANNGREALEYFTNLELDLILMDIHMPIMDGYEATKAIRRIEAQHSSLERMPIIALTANAIQGDKERCLNEGMDDYVAKPFSEKDIITVLNRVAKQASTS